MFCTIERLSSVKQGNFADDAAKVHHARDNAMLGLALGWHGSVVEFVVAKCIGSAEGEAGFDLEGVQTPKRGKRISMGYLKREVGRTARRLTTMS